jgi:hypothetical protein
MEEKSKKHLKEYVLIDHQTFGILLDNFKTRWVQYNMRLVNSGFTRVYNKGIQLGYSNNVVLTVNNKKRAMLTRIRFGF